MSPQNCVWAKGESREERWWRLLMQYNAGPRANRQLFNLNGNPPVRSPIDGCPAAAAARPVPRLRATHPWIGGLMLTSSDGEDKCTYSDRWMRGVSIARDSFQSLDCKRWWPCFYFILFYLFIFLLPLHSLASPLFFVLFVSSLTVRSTSLAREINDRPSSDVFSLYTTVPGARLELAAA